jgi:hypothetical protein
VQQQFHAVCSLVRVLITSQVCIDHQPVDVHHVSCSLTQGSSGVSLACEMHMVELGIFAADPVTSTFQHSCVMLQMCVMQDIWVLSISDWIVCSFPASSV